MASSARFSARIARDSARSAAASRPAPVSPTCGGGQDRVRRGSGGGQEGVGSGSHTRFALLRVWTGGHLHVHAHVAQLLADLDRTAHAHHLHPQLDEPLHDVVHRDVRAEKSVAPTQDFSKTLSSSPHAANSTTPTIKHGCSRYSSKSPGCTRATAARELLTAGGTGGDTWREQTARRRGRRRGWHLAGAEGDTWREQGVAPGGSRRRGRRRGCASSPCPAGPARGSPSESAPAPPPLPATR
eukprot:1185312-Prorocentrum_minimum.AAC.2